MIKILSAKITSLKARKHSPKWDTWSFYMRFWPGNPNPYPEETLQHSHFNRWFTPRLLGDPSWVREQLQKNVAALGYSNRQAEILAWHGYGPDLTGEWSVVSEAT